MSNTQVDHSRLAELAAKLGLHEHLCVIYETREEQFAAALPYLRAGLERGEKCLYTADATTASALLDALRKGGTEVDHYLLSGALTIVDKNEAYLKAGRFDPDLMIHSWTEAVIQAQANRFSGLRTLVADMTWALGGSEGADRLIEYESKLNHFVRDHDMVIVCQYDRARFPPELILGVIRTHPLVVYGGFVSKNPYYIPPEELLKPNQTALGVNRLLKNIMEWEQAQEALRQSKERFRALFEGVQVGVVVSGPKAEVVMCNPAALELLGVTEDQLLGTTSFDSAWKAVYEDGSPCPGEKHPIPQVIATGQSIRNVVLGVYRPVLQDLVWLLVSAQPQFAADGSVTQVICSFEDITERKRAEDDLRRQKEILQKIFDNVPIMINFTGADGRIELVNREWERTIGWTLKEIREQNVDIFAETYPDPRYRQEVLEFVAAAEGKFADFRTRIRDGRLIDTSWARVRLSDGTTIGIGRDISERKRAEESLRRSEAYLAAGQRLSHTGSWALNVSSGELFWSQETYRIFGFDPAQTTASVKETFLPRVHPEDRPKIEEGLTAAAIQKESYDIDYRIVLPDGSIRHIHDVVYPVIGEAGEVVERYGVIMDVTERKRAEERLREFEKVVEGLEEMIVVLDREYQYLIANRAYLNYRGLEREQVVGRSLAEVLNETVFKTVVKEKLDECFRGHVVKYELKYAYPKIGERVLSASYLPIEGPLGIDRVAVVLLDITERKRAEEELQHSRDQLRALAARLQSIREEERKRVAREIHDELGQALTAIRLDLSFLVHDLPAEKKRQSESILKLVDETIQSVRRISTELRPAILDAVGPVAAVEWAAEEFEARTGMKCQLDLPQDDVLIDPERATALFRIFQETLTNVARHANATQVNVRLAKENGDLSLEVADNGIGVSEGRLSARSSLGVLGMRERALLLGGELTITSAPGKGTTVRVRIPQKPPLQPQDEQ